MSRRQTVLCIMDGIGLGPGGQGDAVSAAKTPVLDRLMNEGGQWCPLAAHGIAVGMPSNADMGNSEVGHNAMGAGRIFDQGAKLVQESIDSGSMWESEIWKEAVSRPTVHFIGLLSDGNVHSHINHLLAMMNKADQHGVEKMRVHILTDGRDVSPRSALHYVDQLESAIKTLKSDSKIASGGGRMHITMDRYQADWPMVKRGWECHVHAIGRRFNNASEAIQHFYNDDENIDDQWLPAFVVGDYQGMENGDAVIFFNFRGDRAVEISETFESDSFSHFERQKPNNLFFCGMMEYDGDTKTPKKHLVAPPQINDTVGERMAKEDMKVLSIAETQKFGHVTFFFNGNRSEPMKGEEQRELPSQNIPFDQIPSMEAKAVTQGVCEAIRTQQYDHIRLNLANGDMVGHTGNFNATVKAVEIVDECVGQIVKAIVDTNSILLITADHGNADEMFQLNKKDGKPKEIQGRRVPSTSHSKNPVPFILVDPLNEWKVKPEGDKNPSIAAIGGTLLHLSGIDIPSGYLPSLVERQ